MEQEKALFFTMREEQKMLESESSFLTIQPIDKILTLLKESEIRCQIFLFWSTKQMLLQLIYITNLTVFTVTSYNHHEFFS
jgi:hypothetical protein